MYVDLETGTVLNGPIVSIPADTDTDDLSDTEVIELATRIGTPVQ